MAAKDRLLADLTTAETKWDQATPEVKRELVAPFSNAKGLETFSRLRFEVLPEPLQLMLALFFMENDSLNELAIKEGYLDFDSRASLHRNTVIAATAGSINRGSTATETSAYRRTGTTRWSKEDDGL
jgi:hypothetical protein